MLVQFVVDCPSCEGVASSGITLFTDYEEGQPLQVDVQMSAGQTTFTCADCGTRCYSGDFDVYTDDQL